MKIDRKTQNIVYIAVGFLALIGFIIGTFLDVKITEKMGDFDNLFGILLTAFAPILTLGFGVFAGALLFFMPKQENKTFDIVLRVVGAVAVLVLIFNQFKEGFEYTEFPRMIAKQNTYKALIAVFIGFLDAVLVLFSRIWIKKMDERSTLIVCLLIIATIAIYFVACEVIKYLASRPRPRVLDEGRLFFKQWYQWKPFAAFTSEYHDCKSFVSGHTANAACVITMLPLMLTVGKRDNSIMLQIVASVAGALFTFVVAFSRIVARAHWMTDVMGGILLSVGIQALVINVSPTIIKNSVKIYKI